MNLFNRIKQNFTLPWAMFLLLAGLCLTPLISSPVALVLGFSLASVNLVPREVNLTLMTKKLLAFSIVGLGFGINVTEAIEASLGNLGLIIGSIFFTLGLSFYLTKALSVNSKIGHLIGAGTAICGGSAIAAVAPAINAKGEQIAVALACVFMLNSVALFVFPAIGHALSLSQYEFGVWSAIAIHDTSSVVGAAATFGDEALKTATTIKLARALWIIPIALLSAMLFGGTKNKLNLPYFIVFYCLAIAVAHFFPSEHYQVLFSASKQLLILCLFFIGASITLKKMQAAGPKPLLLGVLLWLAIGSLSLGYIILMRN
ncbi:YeiH family protein [Shewanella sp. SR44-3]|uniref:YeiH family protein n=1 Tax=unclassified Shewanella TaxID=196818 RepID=UPI0015FD9BEB|nr:putative sulfate exporter family transporter [Shewanella sp. SR44-3]MBB1268441.1 putative sulfate exporter family transporter [Shewanella sp. SR44-3]